jgi:signal transduction histidine kinase
MARQIGRRAVAMGLDTLDLAGIHEHALLAILKPVSSSVARDQIIRRARSFFAESITPMEETHRAAREIAVNLGRLNHDLSRRTVDLAASNRDLRREITLRRTAERTLRQSEQRACRLLEQSKRMQHELRLLSRRVLSVQEEERKRISRELHDVIAQMLTGINVRLATLKIDAAASTRGLGRKISRTQRMVEKSVDVVHRFARELRPAILDDLGLIPALHSFLKRFIKETGIRASLTAFAGVEKLSAAKRTVLYRVAQEALTNVARHARAGRVDVNIRLLRNAVHMQVKDDGRSFDADRTMRAKANRSMGLLGMRERVEMVGGSFNIVSSPGKGTSIETRVPFHNGGEIPGP